jgi:hypothetical protein
MMHSGMTVRQASDHLQIPTSTLRHGLREAGLELGPNGTLAVHPPPAACVPARPTRRPGPFAYPSYSRNRDVEPAAWSDNLA